MKIEFLILFLLVSGIGINGASAMREEDELLKPTKRVYKQEAPPTKKEERSFFGLSVDPWSVVEAVFGLGDGKIKGNVRIKDFNMNFGINPYEVMDKFMGDDDDKYENKQKNAKYLY